MVRYDPPLEYHQLPCLYTAVGTAYEKLTNKSLEDFSWIRGLKDDGYASLQIANKFVRQYLNIRKYVYFKRAERVLLSDFLENNKDKCIVCVLGHYIYVDCNHYWSYFDNDSDFVVAIWYIK